MARPISFLYTIIIFFLLLRSNSFSQSEDIRYLNITPLEGIENPVVTCVYQDSYGFTWFGSLSGLYRWDGNKARHYYRIPDDTTSIPYDQINSILFEDEQGNLWLSTIGGGPMVYERKKDRFTMHRFNEKRPELVDVSWIFEAFKDRHDNIWGIGFTNIFFRFSLTSKELEIIIPDTNNEASPVNKVLSFLYDQKAEYIWLGTKGGLYQYLIDDNKVVPARMNGLDVEDLPEFQVSEIIRENDTVLWLATPYAIYKYHAGSGEIKPVMELPLPSAGNIRERIEFTIDGPFKDHNSIWIITNFSLKEVDRSTGKLTTYLIKDKERLFESSEFLAAGKGGFIDKNGFLWLATDNIGAAVINLKKNPFEHFFVSDNKVERNRNGASCFLIDRDNNLWVGTGFNGLYQYNDNLELVNHFKHNPSDSGSLTNNYVYSLFETKDGTMWVGTENGLNRLDREENLFYHYLDEPIEFKGSISHIRIAELFQDNTGRLWVGSSQGAYYSENCDEKEVDLIHFTDITHQYVTYQHIFSDRDDDIWISNPIYFGFFRLHPAGDNWEITNYCRLPDNTGNFFTDGAMSIVEDDEGNFWLGTKEGLYKWNRTENSFEHYYKGKGLNANIIYWMESDNLGNLWMSTEVGLVRFNPSLPLERMCKTYSYQDGLPFEDMYAYQFYKSPDGTFYFGGRRGSGNGYYRFNPDSIVENTHIPPVFITDFKVHGKSFRLDSNIVVTKNIRLAYHEDFFSFEFAALDYTDPGKNQYAYYLEGYDNEWNQQGNRRFANYTGVPPGDYIFRVKGSNNDGYWNETGASIALTILPPPWKTWWAYLFYGLAILAILYFILHYYKRRQQLLHILEIEKIESEKLKELDHMKSRFFANISHEFRTPLSLILGPLEKLLNKTSDGDDKKELNTAKKYATRLQNLINKLLTIAKLEAGKVKLHYTEVNIVTLVKGYFQVFESLAKQRNISLKFISEANNIQAFVDKEKIEQVLNNLLSNAFKFTPEGGSVEVKVSSQQSAVNSQNTFDLPSKCTVISIADTGSGIAPEHLPQIFDRFYQVDSDNGNFQAGTGIGLALAKELVELHHGEIHVESEPGKGTTFFILLPLGKEHLTEEVLDTSRQPVPESEASPGSSVVSRQLDPSLTPTPNLEEGRSGGETDDDSPILLIVEDNNDMRSYIREYFEDEFQINEAIDGLDGYEKAVENIPDIIISDVMMPIMDGNAFCQKIRSDERTSHIPVILLTARASKENRIEGLGAGADDFITKPFDGEELQVRVKNLIGQRQRLQAFYRKELGVTREYMASQDLNIDERFLQKAKNIVEKNLSNSKYAVTDFAYEMALSRVQLYRKLSALLNISTSEFIRNIRLKYAAQLLKKKTASISEIAYDVGFSSPSYFSSSFRNYFGVSPTEYQESVDEP